MCLNNRSISKILACLPPIQMNLPMKIKAVRVLHQIAQNFLLVLKFNANKVKAKWMGKAITTMWTIILNSLSTAQNKLLTPATLS